MEDQSIAIVKFDASLAMYNQMCAAITKCHSVHEVKETRDKAVAFAEYARRARNYEAEHQLIEIRVRAERRCGLILIEMAENGQRQKRGQDQKSKSSDVTSIPTLADLGITKNESADWQDLARIPEDHFEFLLMMLKSTVVSSRRIIDTFIASFRPKQADFDPEEQWKGMPEFSQRNGMPFATFKVHCETEQDAAEFRRLVGPHFVDQKIGPKTKTLYYPTKPEDDRVSDQRWVSRRVEDPGAPEGQDSMIEVVDEGDLTDMDEVAAPAA
jgi:hypothetical protein